MRRRERFPHHRHILSLRWLGLVGLFLLLIWTSSACSVTPAPPILKIGLVAPFEGRYRYIGYDAIYAARLAVREINAAGGISGHRLVLVSYDDRNDPASARDAARNLGIDPDVIAVIGHYRQQTTTAARLTYIEYGMPLLAMGAWFTNTHASVYQLAPPVDRLTDAMVTAALSDEEDACGVIWGDDVLAHSLSSASGMRLCHSDEDNPAFVLSSESPHVAAVHFTEQRTAGWTGKLVGGPELGASDFVDVAGASAVKGQRFLTPYPFPEDLPDTQDWRQAYKSLGPHVPQPGPYALPTYEAVNLLAEALAADIAAHTEPSRDGLRTALREVSRQGRLGAIALNEQGVWQESPLYLYVWRDGEPHLWQVISPPETEVRNSDI